VQWARQHFTDGGFSLSLVFFAAFSILIESDVYVHDKSLRGDGIPLQPHHANAIKFHDKIATVT
jgi:hypothetical protein